MANQRSSKCKHGHQVCSECVVITDAARRMSDRINITMIARTWDELNHGYMAFRLDDGSTDGVLYGSRQDATKHTDARQHAYFCFRNALGGANPRDCQLFLEVHRAAAEANIPWNEPALKRAELIIPVGAHDILTRRVDP